MEKSLWNKNVNGNNIINAKKKFLMIKKYELENISFEFSLFLAKNLVTTSAKDNTVAVPIKTDKLFEEAYSPYVSAPYSRLIIVIKKKFTTNKVNCIIEI